jgi:hypothetical protein
LACADQSIHIPLHNNNNTHTHITRQSPHTTYSLTPLPNCINTHPPLHQRQQQQTTRSNPPPFSSDFALFHPFCASLCPLLPFSFPLSLSLLYIHVSPFFLFPFFFLIYPFSQQGSSSSLLLLLLLLLNDSRRSTVPLAPVSHLRYSLFSSFYGGGGLGPFPQYIHTLKHTKLLSSSFPFSFLPSFPLPLLHS